MEDVSKDSRIRPLIESFYQNAYFTRVWCIQEVHVAKHVQLYYGEGVILGKHLRRVTSAFWRIPLLDHDDPVIP